MVEFEGPRTAVVTGGAQRIGASIVDALLSDGWHVLLHYNHSHAAAERFAAERDGISLVRADLIDTDACGRIMAASTGLPPVRMLVNNASRYICDTAEDFALADWDAHQAVNLRAPAQLSQLFAAQAREGGLIVNILDAKLSQPNPDHFSYTISKMGLAALTELTARAFASVGVRVCGIAPAMTLVSGPQSEANFARVHRLNPLGRGIGVDHIVAALRFLVTTPTLTGEIITLDAGQRFLGLPRDPQNLEVHR